MGTVNFVLTVLAMLTSAACMWFLFRAYAASRLRLLLWSGLVVFPEPEVDLRPYRLVAALIAVGFLRYGFIWESE